MNWTIVKHYDLLLSDALRIAQLKNQHWSYGIESQFSWMDKNIQLDDLHILGVSDNGSELIAYTTISKVTVAVDSISAECFGVGGVCVDKAFQHQGLGNLLIKEASDYIRSYKKQGILLCKSELVPFYENNGWHQISYRNATVAGSTYEHSVMLLDKQETCINLVVDRNF